MKFESNGKESDQQKMTFRETDQFQSTGRDAEGEPF